MSTGEATPVCDNTMFVADQLKARMEKDINTFNSGTPDNKLFESFFQLTKQTNPLSDKISAVKAIYAKIQEIQSNRKESYYITVHSDSTNAANKNQLWVWRTYLLYSILILTCDIIKNEATFKEYQNLPKDPIQSNAVDNEIFTIDYSTVWNAQISQQIQHFKIGIFGSMTVTSDIDIGLQYCNPNADEFVAGLAYIIKIVEDLFIICTSCKSLDFDIELYGNIIFMADLPKCTDIYYLDTTKLDPNESTGTHLGYYTKLLQKAFVSILRNYYVDDQAMPVVADKTQTDPNTNITRIQSEILEKASDAIHWYYNSINHTDYTPDKIPINHSYLDAALMQSIKNILGDVRTSKIWENAFAEFIDYKYNSLSGGVENSYDDKRKQYYKALSEGDAGRQAVYKKVINNTPISLDETIECIIFEARTQSKREESYLLAPTIMHVVRTLQKKESEVKSNVPDEIQVADAVVRYQTSTVECNTENPLINDAKCNIGKYGYYLSILEQLGYMIRFYKHYCIGDHANKTDCFKKLKKYGERFSDALTVIQSLDHKNISVSVPSSQTSNTLIPPLPPPPPKTGGKPRKPTKRSFAKCTSKKNKNRFCKIVSHRHNKKRYTRSKK